MRIQELQLLAYGPFTDCVLKFSAGTEGLHIVYGPNEAGKSSMLRAIQGLLFGIPAKCSDDQIHEKKKLRIGAVLRDSNNKKIRVHRRKGHKNTLLNPKAKKDVPYPDNALDAFLGGIDARTFGRVYGICHEELKRGGEEMQSLRGLVGESLFAATVGGSGLSELLSSLDSEAGELFSERRRNVRLKESKRTYDAIKKARREALLTKSRWEKLQASLGKARDHHDSVVRKSFDLEKELSRLRRIEGGLGFITKRSELQERIASLGSAVLLPEQYSAEQRSIKQTELKEVLATIQRLQKRLDGEDGLRQQIDGIQVPSGLLSFAAVIGDLKDQRAVIVKATKDREVLVRDCDQLRIRVESLMRDLRIGASITEAERFRIAPEQKSHIQQLGTDEKRLREHPTRIRAEQTESKARLAKMVESLNQLGTPVDIGDLKRTVERIHRQGDLERELEALRSSVTKREKEIDRDLATLGLWHGSAAELASLRVPMNETVDRFTNEFSELRQRTELLQGTAVRIRDDETQQRQAIAALQQTGHVPTESELNEVRRDRDKQWQMLRNQAAQRDGDSFSTGADVFETLLASADVVADRLRREADRVAQLADRTVRVEGLACQRKEVLQQLEKAKRDFEILDANWRSEWMACGVTEPLSPREMQSWLIQLHEIRSTSRELDGQRYQLTQHEQRFEASRSEIRECLMTMGVEISHVRLEDMVAKAESMIDAQVSLFNTRQKLEADIRFCHEEIEKLNREYEKAVTALEGWQEKWDVATKVLGCDARVSAEQAHERLNHLTELFQHLSDIASKKQRIADIDNDAALFRQSVERIASQFLDVGEVPPDELVLKLVDQLQTAEKDHERRERLEVEVRDATADLCVATEKEQSLKHQLEALCNLAGAKEVESLPVIEQASRELKDCRQRLEGIEEQLHKLSGNSSIDEFVEAARLWNADDLLVQLSNLETQIADLKVERDKAVAAVTELENEAREADGHADAAEKDQEALGLIGRMQTDAARYMRIRLAVTILRQQIEKHRAENEDPLLQRASTLFARMTCNEFSGIRTDFKNDDPVIVGVRKSNDELVPVTSMSTGTRDQLYLALRLGYVERQLMEHEPMPFIVDDVLIQFDPDRSQATLKVLAELAKQTQVIFFTHHWHLVELAKDGLMSDEYFIHQLDSRARESTTNLASALPR